MTEQKRALITGGTRGIGRAIAEELVGLGYAVVLTYVKDEKRARGTVEQLTASGASATAVRADVTRVNEVKRLFEEALREGAIDLLVNNVGEFLFKPFLDTTPEEWDAILRNNLASTVLCCREILPHMRSRGEGQIVSIASMNAEVLRARPNTLPYAVAKAGIVLLTKSLAKTEGAYGIRVNAVSPGFVETGEHPPTKSIKGTIPLARLARATEIARAVAFLASDQASYTTGAILNVHGGAFL
ncbi:MAG: SDR family oxidoreductase [Candidatus Bipolaricaulia bacterium]